MQFDSPSPSAWESPAQARMPSSWAVTWLVQFRLEWIFFLSGVGAPAQIGGGGPTGPDTGRRCDLDSNRPLPRYSSAHGADWRQQFFRPVSDSQTLVSGVVRRLYSRQALGELGR